MPVSPAERIVPGGISRLIERITVGRRLIPSDGLARSAFVDAFLADVDALAVDEVLKVAHRRKAVFVSRKAGAIRVFTEQPAKGAIPNGITREPLGLFLSSVVPHFHGLKSAELQRIATNEREEWAANGEADDAIRAHVSRILAICRTHADRGLAVSVMRQAMHETFAPDALAALAYYEPRLQEQSKAEGLEERSRQKPKRARKGLSVEHRVLHAIERAGGRGVTKSYLVDLIRPPMPSADVAMILDKLAEEGFVVSGIVRLQAAGRPSTRYFHASRGIPPTDERGIVRRAT